MATTAPHRLDVEGVLEQIDGQPPSHAWNVLFEAITNIDPYQLEGILRGRIPITASARAIRDNLADLLTIRKADAAGLLGVSQSRFSRSNRVDANMLDRTYAITHTFARVAAVLGPKNANVWFTTPNPALDGEAPLELLGTSYGEKRVDNLIEGLLGGAIV
jgi:uncharacterized protein (DUF2384 family)